MGICSGAGDTHISLQPQSVHSLVRSPEQKYDTEPTSVKMRKIKRNPDNSHFDFLCSRAELGADVCWPLPFSEVHFELSNGEGPKGLNFKHVPPYNQSYLSKAKPTILGSNGFFNVSSTTTVHVFSCSMFLVKLFQH